MRTLYQMAAACEDPFRAKCVRQLADSSELFIGMPFMALPGSSFCYNVEGVLPEVAFRHADGMYGKPTRILNPMVETMRIAGGECDTDEELVKSRGYSIIDSQVAMKIRAIGLNIAAAVVNGDSAKDIRVFDGLRKRIVGDGKCAIVPTKSLHWNVTQLVHEVDDCTHLITSKATRRRLMREAREGDGTEMVSFETDPVSGHKLVMFGYRPKLKTRNTFDLAITTFATSGADVRYIPVLVADYDDLGGRVIADGAVIAVNFGDGYVCGLQQGAPEFNDCGLVKSTDRTTGKNISWYRTVMDWFMTLSIMHGHGAAILE